MGGLVLKSKKQAQLLKEKKKASGIPYYKPEWSPKGFCSVFICPPKDEDTTIVTQVELFEAFGAKGKLADSLVSPTNFGETSDIVKIGWSLKNKYAENKKESLKNMFQHFLPKQKNIIFVLDPKKPEQGILQWQAPAKVAEFLLAHIEGDGEDDSGDMSFAHPTKGKLLKVKKVGTGFNTKYTVAGWSDKPLDLGDVDEDKLVELLKDVPNVIGGMFKKPTKDQIQEYKDFLDSYATEKGITLDWKNTKKSQLDTDASDDDDDTGSEVDDEELDVDDEEDAPKKGKAKTSAKSKKPADDEDEDEAASDDDEDAGEDEDLEVDLDDEDDDND